MRGGSVMLRLPERVAPPEVLERFRAHDVFADTRGQVLRLSPGIMTTADGVDRMLAALGQGLH